MMKEKDMFVMTKFSKSQLDAVLKATGYERRKVKGLKPHGIFKKDAKGIAKCKACKTPITTKNIGHIHKEGIFCCRSMCFEYIMANYILPFQMKQRQ